MVSNLLRLKYINYLISFFWLIIFGYQALNSNPGFLHSNFEVNLNGYLILAGLFFVLLQMVWNRTLVLPLVISGLSAVLIYSSVLSEILIPVVLYTLLQALYTYYYFKKKNHTRLISYYRVSWVFYLLTPVLFWPIGDFSILSLPQGFSSIDYIAIMMVFPCLALFTVFNNTRQITNYLSILSMIGLSIPFFLNLQIEMGCTLIFTGLFGGISFEDDFKMSFTDWLEWLNSPILILSLLLQVFGLAYAISF